MLNLHNKYGSSCDWIICHLGSLCSNETISNLIIVGFKEFLNQTAQQQIQGAAATASNKLTASILKLNSIVLILNYFSNTYAKTIRHLLLQMFQVSYLEGFLYFHAKL